jgi:hypothetical protein
MIMSGRFQFGNSIFKHFLITGKMKITEFPVELLLLLKSFVTTSLTDDPYPYQRYNFDESWRLLMNSSQCFQSLKRRTIYFRFSFTASIKYYESPLFRRKVLGLVEKPSRQLSLCFPSSFAVGEENYLSVLNGVHYLEFTSNLSITDVSAFSNVEVLILKGCVNITEVSMLVCSSASAKVSRILDLSFSAISYMDFSFSFVHTLILSHCKYLMDVSCLGNIHTLDLSHCSAVWDVSALSRVHTLRLSFCYSLEDVSSLINVTNLNLSHCTFIEDVSMLGNVYQLDLSFCTSVTDVSALSKVTVLNLCGCSGVDNVSSLATVVELNLSRCDAIREVNMLGRVKKLNLSHCKQLKDVSGLGDVETLILRGCKGIRDVSCLGKVKELDLSNCKQLTGIEYLSNVSSLTLF